MFLVSTYFVFSYYLIYVANLGPTLSKAKKKLKEINPSRSRRAINTNERNDVHIAGKLNASVVPTTFKVGRGQIENDYTNKRLKLGHFYAFSIQSCVLNENSVSIFSQSLLYSFVTVLHLEWYLTYCNIYRFKLLNYASCIFKT